MISLIIAKVYSRYDFSYFTKNYSSELYQMKKKGIIEIDYSKYEKIHKK